MGVTVKQLFVLICMMAMNFFQSAHGADEILNCYVCKNGEDVQYFPEARKEQWEIDFEDNQKYQESINNALDCKNFDKIDPKFQMSCKMKLAFKPSQQVCIRMYTGVTRCIPIDRVSPLSELFGNPPVGECNTRGCVCNTDLCNDPTIYTIPNNSTTNGPPTDGSTTDPGKRGNNKSTPLVGPSRGAAIFIGMMCFFFWGF